MRAAVYLRQSLDRDGSGAAVSRQREDCLALAKSKGWEVAGQYVDNDVSASSRKARPSFERMLQDAESGGFGVIIVWHVDRLARRPVDLERLVELAERKAVRVATVSGDLDLGNDAGRLVARILVSVARAEVERKGARQKRAQVQAAQQGRPAGGPRAAGYEPDGLTIRQGEARLIRQGYKALLGGASLRSIARGWNAAGFRSTRGGEWRPDSVRYVLTNPRNAGLRAHKGEIVGQAIWRGLVPETQWRAALALLNDPARKTTTDTARRYMLSSVARCHCGSLVATGRTSAGARTYKCVERSDLSRNAEQIDDYVSRVIVARLQRPDAAELLVDREREDLEDLRAEAQSLRTRLDEAAGMFADGKVTVSQMTTMNDRITTALREIEGRMSHVDRSAVLADLVSAKDVQRVWDSLDVDRKRAVVQTLCTITLLSPGRGARALDPTTVRIDWQGDS